MGAARTSNNPPRYRFSTRAIHPEGQTGGESQSSAVPIYQTSAFSYSDAQSLQDVFHGRAFGHVYSRISNPTVSAFEARIASLEGGVGAVAVASGMAAISAIVFALTESGDEIIAAESIFGGTLLLLDTVVKRCGVTVRYFSNDDPESIRDLISEKTRFVLVESIGNPKLDVPDMVAISSICRDSEVPFVVDSTLTTAYLLPASKVGASIVLYSGTKYINGSGTAVSGAIVDLGTFDWRRFRGSAISNMLTKYGREFAFLALLRKEIVQNTGAALAPFHAFLCTIGLESLSVRMDRHCSNALELAKFLDAHAAGLEISYPGLTSNKYHARASFQLRHGAGGLVTFRAGNRDRAIAIIDNLRIAKHMTNMGEAKTLVLHPASTIFHGCSAEQITNAGVTDDMIRISVGLEDVDDLKEDFDTALRSS